MQIRPSRFSSSGDELRYFTVEFVSIKFKNRLQFIWQASVCLCGSLAAWGIDDVKQSKQKNYFVSLGVVLFRVGAFFCFASPVPVPAEARLFAVVGLRLSSSDL